MIAKLMACYWSTGQSWHPSFRTESQFQVTICQYTVYFIQLLLNVKVRLVQLGVPVFLHLWWLTPWQSEGKKRISHKFDLHSSTFYFIEIKRNLSVNNTLRPFQLLQLPLLSFSLTASKVAVEQMIQALLPSSRHLSQQELGPSAGKWGESWRMRPRQVAMEHE